MFKKTIFKELIALVSLAVFSTLIAVALQDFVLVKDEKIRVIPAVVALLPLVVFYIVVRQFFARLSGVIFTLLTFALISEINRVKLALTGEPLSWTDISSGSNFSIVWQYFSIKHFLFLFLFIGLILILIKFKQLHTPKIGKTLTSLPVFLFFLPGAFYPFLTYINEDIGHHVQSQLSRWGVIYYSWDWVANVRHSGLLLHLIQTSRRKMPSNPNAIEVKEFSELIGQNTLIEKRPDNVIFILCESCWFNESNFREEFESIQRLPFVEFRAISPTYGGNTVNSSFELLTGLPSHGALTGVIYQEYGPIMRDNAIAYPRAMKSAGYVTVAAHNHHRKFWRRDLVKPKLGFDIYYSREDMNDVDQKFFADDEILFSKVLDEMKALNKPAFYFLTTVYTHGPYPFDGDFGEKDYSARLKKTISRIAYFVDQVLKLQPNTAILIVGDHKPALTRYFHENKVFPDYIFSKTGDRNEDYSFKPKSMWNLVGDVPAFFYHPNKLMARKFADKATGKPLYCLSNYFDEIFVGVDLPAFSFARKKNLCEQFSDQDYYVNAKRFPEYLYALSLLK